VTGCPLSVDQLRHTGGAHNELTRVSEGMGDMRVNSKCGHEAALLVEAAARRLAGLPANNTRTEEYLSMIAASSLPLRNSEQSDYGDWELCHEACLLFKPYISNHPPAGRWPETLSAPRSPTVGAIIAM
jgi:hypothetical protein